VRPLSGLSPEPRTVTTLSQGPPHETTDDGKIAAVRSCANPDCASAVEYDDAQATAACPDCGAAFRLDADPSEADRTHSTLVASKLAATVLGPLVLLGLGSQVPLPGLDAERLSEWTRDTGGLPKLSAFALGLMPMFSAFWIVEIVALLVPPWRGLRTSGFTGRDRLFTATLWLGLGLAIVQALGITVFLDKQGMLAGDPRLSRVVAVASLVAGCCVFLIVTRFLDRAALGGGFALLIGASAWTTVLPLVQELLNVPLRSGFVRSDRPEVVAAVALLGIVATTAFLRSRPVDAEGGARALPLPACGVFPLTWVASAMPFLSADGAGLAREVFGLVTLAVLAVGLGFLFYTPSRVARFNDAATPRVQRAVALSLGYTLVVGLLNIVLARHGAAFDLLPLIPLVALVLDVVAEARATLTHGALVAVWPEHRMYAVESAQNALERVGIPSLARSAHQRVLWHFFAPFIPVQILVPEARADEARARLEAHFSAPTVDIDAVFS
jgi:hypothetical protein